MRLPSLFSICASALLVTTLVSCGGDDDDDGVGPAPNECRTLATAANVPATATLVGIRDLKFSPDTIRIAANTTVYWINCEESSTVVHTVTAVDGTWTSPEIRRGQAYSRAFPAPVVPTPYYSVPHQTTRGAILSN